MYTIAVSLSRKLPRVLRAQISLLEISGMTEYNTCYM